MRDDLELRGGRDWTQGLAKQKKPRLTSCVFAAEAIPSWFGRGG